MGNANLKDSFVDGRGPVVETIAQLQKHQRPNPRNNVEITSYLTREQKALLRNAWTALNNNLSSVGMTTFIKMFETHPEALKYMIPKLTREERENVLKKPEAKLDPWHSERLREHAHRIMKTVSEVISLLNNDEEKIEEMLYALGGKHYEFGVHGEILELMGPHFIAAIYPTLKDTWTEELQGAWHCLFNYICALMHKGYEQALLAKVKPTWINYFD